MRRRTARRQRARGTEGAGDIVAEIFASQAGRLGTEVYALYLDDLVLTPLGVALAIRLIPEPVLIECREKARRTSGGSRPANRVVAAAVVVVWLALAALAIYLTVRYL